MTQEKIIREKIIDYMTDATPIVKYDGRVLKLDCGIIDSTVEIALSNDNSAKFIQTVEKSPYEYTAINSELKHCGFPFVDITYEREITWKQKRINDALLRIGKINHPVDEMISAPKTTEYRNNIQLQVSNGKAGFFKKGTRQLIVPDTLVFAEKPIENAYQHIKSMYLDENIELIGLRSFGDKIMIIIVSKEKIDEEKLKNTFDPIHPHSIYLNVKSSSKRHYNDDMHLIYGAETIELAISNKRFNLLPNAFFQTNTLQAEILYEKAIELLDLGKDDTLLDLYCGMATMGIITSDYVKEVIAIDSNSQAILSAIDSAKNNDVKNLTAICKKAEDSVNILKNKQNVKLILDPPRAGVDKKLINAISQINPQKIVYISCHAETLARDLAGLQKYGYKIKSITGVDMFPRTPHVETVVLLSNGTVTVVSMSEEKEENNEA